jgi:TonB family protein
MTDYLWYILEANCVIALLFGVFMLVRKRLSFTWQRFSLLAIPLLAGIAVWIKQLPVSQTWTYKVPVIQLETVEVGRGSSTYAHSPGSGLSEQAGWLSVETIYWLGALVLAIWTGRKLLAILRLFSRAERKKEQGFTVVELPGQESFSFFRYIQLRKGLAEADRRIVFQHEQLHARKLHSLDLLYMEAVHCFSWFNPVLPFIKKELIHIHEFEVDRIMYRQHNVSYMEFLLSYALGTSSTSYVFTHQFLAQLTLIKRIKIMKHTTKKTWILVLALPVAAGILTLVSWTTGANETPERGATENSRTLDRPTVNNLSAGQGAGESGPETKIDPVDASDKQTAETTKDAKEVMEKKIEFLEPVDTKDAVDEIDKMAEFVGGTEAMTTYMVNNVLYPEKAMKTKTTGTVYVSFVVTKTGKVSEVAIKKGVSSELDAEAKRVIAAMPDWIPAEQDGKTVSSELCLPVAFKL